MANPAGESVPSFRKGQVLLADDLNLLAEAARGRVVGADGVTAGAVGRDVVLRGKRNDRRPAPERVLVTLGSPTDEEGEYEWELYQGSGPAEGTASELNGLVGLPPGCRVWIQRHAGIWYFSAAQVGMVVFELTAVGDNTLTVKHPDGADTFTIWKPVHLQRRTFHGLSIGGVSYSATGMQTRTATSGDSETQLITPTYVVGDTLLAGPMANLLVAGDPVRLVDLNNAGRQWCREVEE